MRAVLPLPFLKLPDTTEVNGCSTDFRIVLLNDDDKPVQLLNLYLTLQHACILLLIDISHSPGSSQPMS